MQKFKSNQSENSPDVEVIQWNSNSWSLLFNVDQQHQQTLQHDRDQGKKTWIQSLEEAVKSSVPCQVTSIFKEAFHTQFILFMICSSSFLHDLNSYCSSSIQYDKLRDHACWSPDLLLHHDFNITYFHKLFILPNSITPHLICCKWS